MLWFQTLFFAVVNGRGTVYFQTPANGCSLPPDFLCRCVAVVSSAAAVTVLRKMYAFREYRRRREYADNGFVVLNTVFSHYQ